MHWISAPACLLIVSCRRPTIAADSPPTPVDARVADVSTDTAATSSVPDSAATVPASCPDAGSVDVYVEYVYVPMKGVGQVLTMRISAPAIGLKKEINRDAGPTSCSTSVVADTLVWDCMVDMGSVSGSIAVSGGAIVHRSGFAWPGEAMDSGALHEEWRAPWPCGARPHFHTKSFSNVPTK